MNGGQNDRRNPQVVFALCSVCVDNESGKMWIDNDTLSAHFDGDAIWDEENSDWLQVDDLTEEEANRDNKVCDNLYQLLEKFNKELG